MITLVRLTAIGIQRVVHWVYGFDKADRQHCQLSLFTAYPDAPATRMSFGR